MTPTLRTVIYPVKDLASAKTLYGTLLGEEPSVDEVYYVQFNGAHQEVGLDPNGHSKGMTGPVGYWHVEDIKDALRICSPLAQLSSKRSATSAAAR